jgi:uncharacterized protein (DUF2164 family)
MNLNEKMINSTKDKEIIRFYQLFKFLNKQKMPKVGDHVFRKHSDGRKINNALYIVDGVIEPGIVIGRKLLSNGKSYGKVKCINSYLQVETDSDQLVSVLIDQNHNYMEEQQEKHKEKRRLVAKVRRYNKKICKDTISWGDFEFIDFFNSIETGTVFYQHNNINYLKNNFVKFLKIEKNVVTLEYRHGLTRDVVICNRHRPLQRFITIEVPIAIDDIQTI